MPLEGKKSHGIMKMDMSSISRRKLRDWWVDDLVGGAASLATSATNPLFSLAPPFDQANLLVETEYCYARMMKNLDPKQGGSGTMW